MGGLENRFPIYRDGGSNPSPSAKLGAEGREVSLGWSILRSFASAPCPNCAYHLEFQLIDARCALMIICPACKSSIDLQDENASVWQSEQNLDAAEESLRRTVEQLNRELRKIGL